MTLGSTSTAIDVYTGLTGPTTDYNGHFGHWGSIGELFHPWCRLLEALASVLSTWLCVVVKGSHHGSKHVASLVLMHDVQYKNVQDTAVKYIQQCPSEAMMC